MNEIYLSIVVPLYNEESNVGPLCDAIMREILEIDLDYEILLVNDGSQDKTLAAAEAASLDSRINVIDLKKHYGQTAAMASGISMARGRWIVTIDGDLQNDPADIPMMIEKAKEGYDIVVGWRHRRKDHLWLRKIPSALANKLIGLITGVPIKDNGCTLKVFRSKLIKCIPFYSDMHRFLPVLLTMTGARIAEVKVRHNLWRHIPATFLRVFLRFL
jgi:glycosyltransferase involved in cell wall biosynthesis